MKIISIIDSFSNGYKYWLPRVYKAVGESEINILTCFDDYVEKPTKEQIEHARFKLESEIANVSDIGLVVCFGGIVAKVLFGKNTSLRTIRNRYFTKLNGNVCIFTFSPLLAWQQPAILESIVADVKWAQTHSKVVPLAVKYDVIRGGIYIDTPKPRIVGFDIETNGLTPFKSGARVLCLSASSKPGTAISTAKTSEPSYIDYRSTLVGHNIKFDMLWMRAKGQADFQDFGLFDTKVAASLLNENMPENSLKHLAAVYTDMGHYEDVIDRRRLEQYPIDDVLQYNMRDADASRRLYDVLNPLIIKNGYQYLFKFLMDVEKTLVNMELRGIAVDKPKLDQLDQTISNSLLNLKEQLYVGAANEFNVNSTRQVADVLYNRLNLTPILNTKKGAPSVGAPAIRALLRSGVTKEQADYLKLYQQYKRESKLKSTYIDAFKEYIKYDGNIHTTYNIGRGAGLSGDLGAVTGRLSSSNPNLQNIPRDGAIKGLFKSRPTFNLWWADYRQLELRLLAEFSQDKALLDIFESGVDPFTAQLAVMFGEKYEDLEDILHNEKHRLYAYWKGLRTAFKTISYGVIYGIGPNRLSFNLTDIGISVSPDEAYKYRCDWLNRFDGAKRWIRKTENQIVKTGMAVCPSGRVRHLPGASRDTVVGRRLLRQGVNSVIQGTASEITEASMVIVDSTYVEFPLLLNVHDQLVGETKHDEEYAKKTITDIMEKFVKGYIKNKLKYIIKVPLAVDFGFGEYWK